MPKQQHVLGVFAIYIHQPYIQAPGILYTCFLCSGLQLTDLLPFQNFSILHGIVMMLSIGDSKVCFTFFSV